MSLWAFYLWHHPYISTQGNFLSFSVSHCCCIVQWLGNSWAIHKLLVWKFAFSIALVQVCINICTLKNDLNCSKNESMYLTQNCAEILLSRSAGNRRSNKPTEALSHLRPHQADLINGFSCSRGRCWRGVLVSDNWNAMTVTNHQKPVVLLC